MENTSLFEKETLIVGTILDCTNELRKINSIFPKRYSNVSLMENTLINIYHFNMSGLYGKIVGMGDGTKLFENFDDISKLPSAIKNNRQNFYSYFKKVYNFLDGYAIDVQQSLNENLNVSISKVKNPTQLNILTFKTDLKKIIEQLEGVNDTEVIMHPLVLQTKLFARKPLFVYGYDICNNLALRKELFDKFSLTDENLLSIIFDKSNKQLLFIPKNTSGIISYDLKSDKLDTYNSINTNTQFTKTYTIDNYLQVVKDEINQNIIEVYKSASLVESKLKFTDNLFGDVHRESANKHLQAMRSSIIKL